MKAIVTMMKTAVSVAVVVVLILSLAPVVQAAGHSMFDVYGSMADSLFDGSCGSYSTSILTKLETSSEDTLDILTQSAEAAIADLIALSDDPALAEDQFEQFLGWIHALSSDFVLFFEDLAQG